MNIMFAALNPNISEEQFHELIKLDVEQKKETMNVFLEGIDKLKTKEQKTKYINVGLPILITFMLF